MANRVTFNPDTGTGEFIGNNNDIQYEQQEEINHQELIQHQQDRSFRNTAEFLSRRSVEKEGNDVKQVGAGSIELEVALQEAQKELYQLQNGQLPSNPLRMMQLEALQNQLASRLVGGESAPQVNQESSNDDWDLKADLEEGLASDPAVQNTLQWSADTFSQDTNESFNGLLDASTDAETTQNMVQTLKDLRSNPDAFTTVESSQLNPLSQPTLDWFSSEYSPAIAKEVATINAAVRNGVASKGDAMALVMKSPQLMSAFLAAAHNPNVDFTLGL